MAKKNIGATLSIKDGGFIASIKNAVKGTDNLKNSTVNATGSLKKMGTQSKSLGGELSSLAKKAAGVVTAYLGFRQAIDFGKEALELAKEQTRVYTQLDVTLSSMGYGDGASQNIKDYAKELSKSTIYSSTAITSAAAEAATFFTDETAVKSIMKTVTDYAAGMSGGVELTTMQLTDYMTALAKMTTGAYDSMTKKGFEVTDAQKKILENGTDMAKVAVINDIIAESWEGMAAAFAETDEGKFVRLKNTLIDMKQELGEKMLPLLGRFAGWANTKIPAIRKMVVSAIDKIQISANWFKKNALEPIKKVFTAVWEYGVSAFNNIRSAVERNMPKFKTLKAVLLDVKEFLFNAFEKSKPTLIWLKDVGLPLLVDAVGTVIQKATELYNYIKDNWEQIGPIVWGITNAVLAYKAALIITNTWTKIVATTTAIWTGAVNLWKAAKSGALGVEIAYSIWRTKDIIETGILIALYAKDAIVKGVHSAATWVQVAATGALTAGQWLLNAAFYASPIGWIVLGIGLIVGAFILLWNKCEPFRNFFLGMWDAFKAKIDAFGGGFKGFVNLIISGMNGLISKFIGGINGMIDGVNSISGKIGIPAIPHIPIPQIPMLAQGGIVRRAGSVIVGEKGPELLSLNRGAKVTPLGKTNSKTENNITINVYADGKSAEEIVDEVVPKLKLALANL